MSVTLTLKWVTKIFILAERMKQYNGTNQHETNSVHVEAPPSHESCLGCNGEVTGRNLVCLHCSCGYLIFKKPKNI